MKAKTKKIAIVAGSLAAIGALLYFLMRKKDDSTGDSTRSGGSGGLLDTGGGISTSVDTDNNDSTPEIEKKVWSFLDNYWTGGFSDVGHLGFVGASKPPFSNGDIVYVKQSEGAKYPQYDGMTKIDGIHQTDAGWVVDTTKSRRGDTPVNAGIMTNYTL